jgi:RNA12 protein
MYVFDTDPASRNWTPEQAWYLIREMATVKNGIVPYNQLMLSDLFKEHLEEKLRSLEQADLILVISTNSRPHAVKPGRPVYHAAFKRLIEDRVLRSRMDLAILTQLVRNENQIVSRYEDELHLLGNLETLQHQVDPRIQWVLSRLRSSQAKINQYEKESALLRDFLKSNP